MECSNLTKIEIPDSVISIGSQAFSYCTGLTKIFIPKSVITISANSNPLFFGCSSLEIFCEVTSEPDGWGGYWNYYSSLYNCSTHRGYTREQFNAL